MDEDDYESLPDTAGPHIHMVAGGMAGMLEHCVMFPFDTVKVRRARWVGGRICNRLGLDHVTFRT